MLLLEICEGLGYWGPYRLESTEQVKSNFLHGTDRTVVLPFLIGPFGWPGAIWEVLQLVECILKFATWPLMALHQFPTLELSGCDCTKCC